MSPSFGRGAMTNSWPDLMNAELFLIAGSNCAENHPIAMRWINKAKERGAKVIVVDPRFTRTASQADIFAQIRPGTDIAYLGAIINYILENELYDHDYVLNYTNALYKISKDFQFKDGLFSGFDPEKKKYKTDSWGYQLDESNKPVKALVLTDPDSVFSKLKEHYSRYDMKTAENITGIPASKIKEIADAFCSAKPASILYALGMTHHTTGVQGIRCYGIIQLLMGNIGKAGGGINALRGEPNVQGSTDMANLYNNLPGYLPAPSHSDKTLKDYLVRNGSNREKHLVSLLKAWFGDKATKENDYCFNYLPKYDSNVNSSLVRIWDAVNKGQFQMMLNIGSNSLVSVPNLEVVRQALPKLEMLVVSDLFEIETAQFWREPGVDPSKIMTEVIFLPAAFVYEKDGTLTNSGRWVQWKDAALKPLGECKPDLDMLDLLYKRVKSLYEGSTNPKDRPILDARWDYGHEPKALKVLQELNGYDETSGELLPTLADYLKAPVGSVSTGCWIYAGVTGKGNLAARRGDADPSGLGLFREWSFAWPGNIRILYNRASCDAQGQPVDPKRKLIWWDAAKNVWAGNDGADVVDKTKGPDTPEGKLAFRMNPEGVGRLFAGKYTSGIPTTPSADGKPVGGVNVGGICNDGPLPEFYEPVESPAENIFHPNVSSNPIVAMPKTLPDVQKVGNRKDYPYVLTTYGVSEHFCAGGITRNIPMLNELMPEPFAEISKNLAAKIGVQDGDRVEISSARGKVEIRCLVTDRIQSYEVHGQPTETIGVPWSWGFASLNPGSSINEVTIGVIDPTAGTPEYKCCLVNIRRA
ncbi:formate dehydrogenase subunit alpha [Dehalobacter restrictus DSM 9455]|uniref:Formate dehydrogenase subunit alpha n=1 Tax=Dehalobacter restrictus (strain DSM 9455 / PER-K23) TaxID=871738 RepID=A0ABN4BSI9_DEHRP|nr:formate dehydrogenase subunit alpha [Dehalobacter restrictus DSM 9455]